MGILTLYLIVKNDIIAEGTHVRIPWVEWPIVFDVRTRPRNLVSLTGSKGWLPNILS